MIGLVMEIAQENVDVLTNVVSSLGFPVFVAVWLLWKSHKDTEVMQGSINKLENAILELNMYIRTLNERENK